MDFITLYSFTGKSCQSPDGRFVWRRGVLFAKGESFIVPLGEQQVACPGLGWVTVSANSWGEEEPEEVEMEIVYE